MNSVGVILASGSGKRFDAKDTPKHLTLILDIPIIVWTIKSVIKSRLFSSIVIVVRNQDILKTKKILNQYFSDNAFPIRVTKGSNKRIDSFFLGLDDLINAQLVKSDSIIALFDANRPFTPVNQLTDLNASAKETGCSCPVRPVVNGIAQVNLNHIIDVPDKLNYVEFVTPEFMQFGILKDAQNSYGNIYGSLVEYALASKVMPSTTRANLLSAKLTFPEDRTFLEGLALDHNLIFNSE